MLDALASNSSVLALGNPLTTPRIAGRRTRNKARLMTAWTKKRHNKDDLQRILGAPARHLSWK